MSRVLISTEMNSWTILWTSCTDTAQLFTRWILFAGLKASLWKSLWNSESINCTDIFWLLENVFFCDLREQGREHCISYSQDYGLFPMLRVASLLVCAYTQSLWSYMHVCVCIMCSSNECDVLVQCLWEVSVYNVRQQGSEHWFSVSQKCNVPCSCISAGAGRVCVEFTSINIQNSVCTIMTRTATSTDPGLI